MNFSAIIALTNNIAFAINVGNVFQSPWRERTQDCWDVSKKTHIIIRFDHPFLMLYNVCGCNLKIVSQISKAMYFMKVFTVENEIYNCSSVKFQCFHKKGENISWMQDGRWSMTKMHAASVAGQNMHFSWQKEREILQEISGEMKYIEENQAPILQNQTVLLNQCLCFL